MKLLSFVATIVLVLIFAAPIFAQTDSLKDTTKSARPLTADSTKRTGQSLLDSLNAGLQMAHGIKPAKPEVKRPPYFSFVDSVTAYFTSPRLDRRTSLDQSWHHDAGDYFRFDPSYIVRNTQSTPSRSTVQPYGLTGDRLNSIVDNVSVHPFEHIVEPDGMADMNDIPTTWDKNVFILPGAAGMIFGGENATATLFTRPIRPLELDPQSALLVDKGFNGFANTRGFYSKRFSDGRMMDLALGYRSTGLNLQNANDDAYKYDGLVLWPTSTNQALSLTGHLYSRQGETFIEPDVSTPNIASTSRDRYDRTAQVGYQIRQGDKPDLWEFGYSYQSHGSSLDQAYFGRFKLGGNGLYVRHDWQTAGTLARAEFSGDRLKFDNGQNSNSRYASNASLTITHPFQSIKIASKLALRWSESFGLMPQATVLVTHESEKSFVMASVGSAEREPSLYERFLPYEQQSLYPGTTYDYADSGNPSLKIERQLVASLLYERGKLEQALRLEVTGGTIINGIDWNHQILPSTPELVIFSPMNENVNFVTVSGEKSLKFNGWFNLHGGAAYHYVSYAGDNSRPYQPDYNAFGGAELHYFWKQKLIDFWAYGEAVYVGPYDGYFEPNLGNTVICNAKVSFKMGNFRFHVVWQNVFGRLYQARDYFSNDGQMVSYGFTWKFFD